MEVSPSLKAVLDAVVEKVPGVEHIVVSNSFGLPVIRVSADGATSDPSALETLFPTVFALCGESVEKLQLGKTKTATTFYESHIVVQAALFPLVLAIVAKADANAAALDVAAMELAKALEPLRVAAENA